MFEWVPFSTSRKLEWPIVKFQIVGIEGRLLGKTADPPRAVGQEISQEETRRKIKHGLKMVIKLKNPRQYSLGGRNGIFSDRDVSNPLMQLRPFIILSCWEEKFAVTE